MSKDVKNKNNTKKPNTKQPQKKSSGSEKSKITARQILAACFSFLGIFILIALVSGFTGPVGAGISTVLRGLFGICAFIVPFVLFFLTFLLVSDRSSKEFKIKIYSVTAIIVSISVLADLISNPSFDSKDGFPEFIAFVFKNGTEKLISGGIMGGIIYAPCVNLLYKTGTVILMVLVLLIAFMLLTGITYKQILKFFLGKIKNTASDVGEKIKAGNEGRMKNIDIPVGDFNNINKLPSADEVINALQVDTPDEEIEEPEFEQSINQVHEEHKKEESSSVIDDEVVITHQQNNKNKKYMFPSIKLLGINKSTSNSDVSAELKHNSKKLIETLASFGVDASVVNVSRGPSVTRYEIVPSVGVKISKISNLSDDIALSLSALSVRIEAPIPGKAAIGIEIPNKTIDIVYIRDLLSSKEFTESNSNLTVALGKDITGKTITADLAKMPHLLIAGATGSGKSVCINSLIISLVYKSSPDDIKLLMIDPKVVELSIYNGIPHLLIPVVTDPKKASSALSWAVNEMMHRYKLFAEHNVRDLRGYNEVAKFNDEIDKLPQIVIIIDELADLMIVAKNDVEDAVFRLAQMARAAGMHLVVATQRPSVEIITGTIKGNIPSRIGFAVSSQINSRIILEVSGAEKLLGRGDMLYIPMGSSNPTRIQGCFVSDKEVEDITNYIKTAETNYSDEIIEHIERGITESNQAGDRDTDDKDEFFESAVEVCLDAGLCSTSLLQRKCKLGYARAARIVDQMEEAGIVGPYEGSKPRAVMITRNQWLEMKITRSDDNAKFNKQKDEQLTLSAEPVEEPVLEYEAD